MELQGKAAVITGGSDGIGLAVAQALAREGVHVIPCGRNEDRARQRAQAIGQQHIVQSLAVGADVSKAEDVQKIIEAVTRQFGAADILINKAGVGSNETVSAGQR